MKDGLQYILYNLPEDKGEVQVVVENETLWCTQKAMAQLFGVGVPAISKHLKNILTKVSLSVLSGRFQNGNNHSTRSD